MYLPPEDRSGWDALQAQILYLINMALEDRPAQLRKITLVAESFGGCLGLRIAAAAPKLVRHLVLVNPATSFNRSLSGLSSFVSATNLLGLFPQDMYNTAQAVLLPFLVDIERVGPEATSALKSMIFMEPPQDFDPEVCMWTLCKPYGTVIKYLYGSTSCPTAGHIQCCWFLSSQYQNV